MLNSKALLRTTGIGVLAFLGGVVGSWVTRPSAPQAGPVTEEGQIAATFGVGGVLTAEGAFWQYRPDKGKWLRLDESFALEGEATAIEPLPVPLEAVRHAETFGFLVTRDDVCWLYNIEEQRWTQIGKPPGVE